MIQRLVGLLLFLIVMPACGSKEEASLSEITSLEGKDFTGNYRFKGAMCFDNNATITSVASPSASSYVSTLTVNGNDYTSTSVTSNCTVRMVGRIVATETYAGSGYSVGTISQRTKFLTVSGASSCTLSMTLEAASGYPSITPATITRSYTSTSPLESLNFDYFYNDGATKYLNFPSVLQVTGRLSDICYLVYQKI